MPGVQVKCVRCEKIWKIDRQVSDLEQQSWESNPCPKCGSMTLRCLREVPDETPLRLLLNAARRQKTEAEPEITTRAA